MAGITPDIKGRGDFKEFIGFLARTDAVHDFGGNGVSIDDYATNINIGLDGVIETDRTDEHGALKQVLIDINDETLLNYLPRSTTQPKSIRVGFRGNQLHDYTCTCKIMVDRITGDDLVTSCGLENGGTLVVDFNQNKFLDILSKSTNKNPKINVVTNAQTINDGAGKTKFNDPIFNNTILQSIIDKKNKPTIYSKWSDNDMTANNLFLTSYQLELTPVIEVKSLFGKIQKLSVNITVSDIGKKTKTVIKDSKKNNSIGEIWKKISGIIASFRTKPFEVNEAIQRKRNGDWGQGTSCFTLDDGEYYASDLRSKIGVTFNLDTTYYVTHDHIAAAYILTLGLNLLFLAVKSGDVGKRVYIFKNNTHVSNPADYFHSILIRQPEGAPNNDKTKIFNALTSYDKARDQFLEIFTNNSSAATVSAGASRGVKSSIPDEIAKLKTFIDEQPGTSKDPNELKKKCIDILDRAYLYQQIKQTTPDPKRLIAELEPDIPDPTPDNLESLKKMYEAFIAAQNINKLYDNNTDFDNIIAKIKISNVYLTLKYWTYTKELKSRGGIPLRLGIKIGSSEENAINNQDKFAFIPFLVTCDSEIKRQIVEVFGYLLTKLISVAQFIQGRSGSTYDHAVLSFKILCETVCIYLGESSVGAEEDNFKTIIKIDDKTKIEGGRQAKDNLLSQKSVILENQEANEYTSHLVDSLSDEASVDAEASAAAGAAAPSKSEEERLSGINADIEENLLTARGGGTKQIKQRQKGGVFVLNHASLPRLLNHNSIKEATHVMLTAHLLLNVPATGDGARSPSQNEEITNRQQLIGQINTELSARNEFANPANADRRVGGAIPVISDTEIFSPSLPIYIVLDGLREVIPRLNGHHDYDDYVTYYLLLESMNEQLKEHPLPLIGFALREILITFISTQVGRDTIAPLFDEIAEDYNLFPLTTTTISADVCGSFVDYDEGKPEVIELAKAVVESAQVKRYINSVIDIYKKKTRKSFYTRHNYNLKVFIDKVNKLQKSIGKEIIHHKTTSKSKVSRRISMKKLTNLIGKIHNFMTKRNRNMAILKNRSMHHHNFSASRFVKVRGGKGRKTVRRRRRQ